MARPTAAQRAHAARLLATLIVGFSFPVVGELSAGLPPLLLTAIRFAIAAAVIAPFVVTRGDNLPSLRAAALYAVMGLGLAAFFGAMFWAAHRASALSMSSLYLSGPLLAYALGRLFGVERRDRSLLLLLVLGAAGALAMVLTLGTRESRIGAGSGEAVFFAGCVVSSLYPVLTKWGLQRKLLSAHAGVRTFWCLVAGSLAMAAAGSVAESPATLAQLEPRDLLILAYLAVFSSAVTFGLTQYAAAILTPAVTTAYGYLAPFVSLALLLTTAPATAGWAWLPGALTVVATFVFLLRRDLPGNGATPAQPADRPRFPPRRPYLT